MFANYTGKRGRSMSTTDVCGADDADDDASGSRRPFSSLLRRQIRRAPARAPPVPPRRADGCGADSPTTTLTRVRSYLSDDIRREFESTMARVDEEPRSPSSSSFVKKLVATLERRRVDGAARGASPDAFGRATFRQLSRQDRSLLASPPEEQEQGPRPAMDFSPRCGHLEELHEADNEQDSSDELESDSSDDYPPDRRRQPDAARAERKPSQRRSLRSVFSSLVNWRIGGRANLPKGSRDYYAARESLGEELRAFRRDTMPRLMEHAAVNGRLPFAGGAERPGRDGQDFAELLRAASAARSPGPLASPRCLATIHPIYGACKASAPARAAPTQPRPTASTTEISDERLLRPSRLRDLQKRISREIDALAGSVELRSSSVSDMHYDVPKSNRPVVVEEYAEEVHYQNVGQAVVSQDERLSCTMFTTF